MQHGHHTSREVAREELAWSAGVERRSFRRRLVSRGRRAQEGRLTAAVSAAIDAYAADHSRVVLAEGESEASASMHVKRAAAPQSRSKLEHANSSSSKGNDSEDSKPN
eukprot:6180756-Pleurochrysis_carterae.AAC.1